MLRSDWNSDCWTNGRPKKLDPISWLWKWRSGASGSKARAGILARNRLRPVLPPRRGPRRHNSLQIQRLCFGRGITQTVVDPRLGRYARPYHPPRLARTRARRLLRCARLFAAKPLLPDLLMMGSGMAMATPPRSLFKLRHTSSVTASHTSPSRSLPSLESTQLAPTDLRQRFSMGITNSSSSIHSTRLSSACRKHIASSRLHPLPKGTFSVSSKARRSRAKPLYYDPRTTLCGKRLPSTSAHETELLPRDQFERDFTFLGLAGIFDPPRIESAGAVADCLRAGITPCMLTGDHSATATAIALSIGTLGKTYSKDMVMTGQQFDALTDEQVDALQELPLVVARCAPETKVRIVDAIHRRGMMTVMTGDGVNDAGSLKRADVSVGMGSGSDVAKQSASVVLAEDYFATIFPGHQERAVGLQEPVQAPHGMWRHRTVCVLAESALSICSAGTSPRLLCSCRIGLPGRFRTGGLPPLSVAELRICSAIPLRPPHLL